VGKQTLRVGIRACPFDYIGKSKVIDERHQDQGRVLGSDAGKAGGSCRQLWKGNRENEDGELRRKREAWREV